MSDVFHKLNLVLDGLEKAKAGGRLGITRVDEEPRAPYESPVIVVTTKTEDGAESKTRVTLETDGRGIYYVEGRHATVRDAIRRIAETAIS